MSRLLASLDAPPSGRARSIWFDAASYGRAKLLGGAGLPWTSPAELSSFFAKIGGMLRSDAVLVDLADRPVLNVADYYEWPVLIQTDAPAAWPHGPVPGVAAWIGSDPPAGPDEPCGRWGIVAGSDFWAGVGPPAEADLVLAPVPADADPEAVMTQVRASA